MWINRCSVIMLYTCLWVTWEYIRLREKLQHIKLELDTKRRIETETTHISIWNNGDGRQPPSMLNNRLSICSASCTFGRCKSAQLLEVENVDPQIAVNIFNTARRYIIQCVCPHIFIKILCTGANLSASDSVNFCCHTFRCQFYHYQW